MDFHRCLTSSNFGRYLFVEQTKNDQRHHLSFARRQRFIALTQLCNFCLLYTPRTVPLQRDLNRIQQILIAEWLSEELDRSRSEERRVGKECRTRVSRDD